MAGNSMEVTERIKQHLRCRTGGAVHEGHAGFSAVRILRADRGCAAGIWARSFHAVNIFEDLELRDELKRYSNWPTYPQLYVKGELVGGCDIAMQMMQSGELKQLIERGVGQAAA